MTQPTPSLKDPLIIVTGAAGFIGSCIVARLNERGQFNLILVDHFDDAKDLKHANLRNKKYKQYYDKKDFLKLLASDGIKEKVSCLIHMGACSSTTCQDAQYFKENNLEYTQTLAAWALKNGVRFIYASSAATYGDGEIGYSDDNATTRRCKPLNLYGQSKQDFDIFMLDHHWDDKMVGLKFFNVFGPNEYHKEDMRSVIAKSYDKVVSEGVMKLFKSTTPQYGDGGQRRDFIYAKDAVEIVLFFMDNPKANGIFNVGTGKARSWNDLANALFKAAGKNPRIEYFDMPESLKPRYQNFTQAEVKKLRAAGYTKPMTSLEEAVEDYARYLKDQLYW